MKKTRIPQRGINHRNEAAYIKKHAPVNPKLKIHLADEGQDLLWFVVDTYNDKIIEAGLFHNNLYTGKYVFCPRTLRPGLYVEYSDTPIVAIHQPLTRIKYKITQIEHL